MTYCQSITQLFNNCLGQMYRTELKINDTTESNTPASYLDLLLLIGRDGQLHTSLNDKNDDLNFHITNFHFLSSNIPSLLAYGVFISQLILYARACFSYKCFFFWERRDFHVSFSSRNLPGNVWNRPSDRRSVVEMGISSNIMKSPSSKCYMTV